ncbi:MAG: glycerol-3-phosphate 1-O-acyltransferase PlsY [bacterium]|nr:glycerol-3-phosphate 1-O-acyltransferase PlsY [Planctomycetota bacterium]HIL52336.1 glycerol-3-phosphate 1-O-acyltransferase [Planctomycetota bacterium]
MLAFLYPTDLLAAGAFEAPGQLAWRLALSYLLGAVPFGLMLCRVLRGVDLRQVGSGNIGATNAMRVLGKPLGTLAFALDFGKGFVPAALIGGGHIEWQVLCGAAAVCGHVWSIFLRFRGGKAVATGCGALLALDPFVCLGAGLVWLVVLLLCGFVSVASLAMGLAFPLLALWRGQASAVVLGAAALAGLILVRHRSNIQKLRAGTESRTALWARMHPGAGSSDSKSGKE